jgi:hypothetical protein
MVNISSRAGRYAPIPHAASLKLACPSSYYIPDPFAIPSISERNEESFRRSKNIQWRPVDSARLSTYVCQNTEAGQSGGKSARDSVRNSEIQGCHPAFAESD